MMNEVNDGWRVKTMPERGYQENVDPTIDIRDRDEAHHRIGGEIHECDDVQPGERDVGPWAADERREQDSERSRPQL